MNKKYLLCYSLIIALSCLLLGVWIGYSATPTQPIWISSGNYPGAPSYTVWREGNYYYAKNVRGEIVKDAGSFSPVIQYCIDALTSGGTIELDTGTFYDNGVEVNVSQAGISIVGQGKNTRWISNSGATKSALVVTEPNFRIENFVLNSTVAKTTSGAGIACSGAWTVASGDDRIATVNVIRNMIIEGYYEAIRLDTDTRMVFIENVDIRNVYEKGIALNNASFIYLEKVTVYNWARSYNVSLHLMNCYSVYAHECEFLGSSQYGVLSDPTSGVVNRWLRFSNCAVETNESASLGNGWVFSNNQGGNNEGVYLFDCWAVSCLNGIILDGVNDAIISNAQVHGNDQHGLELQDNYTRQIQIIGGHYSCNSRSANETYDGIHVLAHVGNFTIAETTCLGNNLYGETGDPYQRTGIRVESGAGDHYLIRDNWCNDNAQNAVVEPGTGSYISVGDNIAG